MWLVNIVSPDSGVSVATSLLRSASPSYVVSKDNFWILDTRSRVAIKLPRRYIINISPEFLSSFYRSRGLFTVVFVFGCRECGCVHLSDPATVETTPTSHPTLEGSSCDDVVFTPQPSCNSVTRPRFESWRHNTSYTTETLNCNFGNDGFPR